MNESTDITFHTLNRPQDAQAIRAAIRELRNRGLGDYEIARATELSVEFVRRVLGECSDIGAINHSRR